MRSNWGWVGAGKDNRYKLGIACADGVKKLGKIKERR